MTVDWDRYFRIQKTLDGLIKLRNSRPFYELREIDKEIDFYRAEQIRDWTEKESE